MFSWPLYQVNISNAFSNDELQEIIYIEQPTGLIDHDYLNHICLLQISLYDLKQAHRAWFYKLIQFLPRIGFTSSQADHSLFFFFIIIIGLACLFWCILMTLLSQKTIWLLLHAFFINSRVLFLVHDLINLNYFLVIEFTHASSNLFLDQWKYWTYLLKNLNMHECNHYDTLQNLPSLSTLFILSLIHNFVEKS